MKPQSWIFGSEESFSIKVAEDLFFDGTGTVVDVKIVKGDVGFHEEGSNNFLNVGWVKGELNVDGEGQTVNVNRVDNIAIDGTGNVVNGGYDGWKGDIAYTITGDDSIVTDGKGDAEALILASGTVFDAGAGDDSMVAGLTSSDTTFTGGTGADQFQFLEIVGDNYITDFNPWEGDTLLIGETPYDFGAVDPGDVVTIDNGVVGSIEVTIVGPDSFAFDLA